jgi:hypothetical protein
VSAEDSRLQDPRREVRHDRVRKWARSPLACARAPSWGAMAPGIPRMVRCCPQAFDGDVAHGCGGWAVPPAVSAAVRGRRGGARACRRLCALGPSGRGSSGRALPARGRGRRRVRPRGHHAGAGGGVTPGRRAWGGQARVSRARRGHSRAGGTCSRPWRRRG